MTNIINGAKELKIPHRFTGLTLDLNKILLHPLYLIQFQMKAKYKLWAGSRDSGKSTNPGAIYMAIKWLSNFNRNIVVLRKYMVDHEETTLASLIKAFTLLAEIYDLPELIPQTADEARKKGTKSLIVYTKGNKPRISNTITNSKFYFVSLNRYEGQKSFSLQSNTQAIDTIWYEEPVELEDINKGELLDDTSFFAFKNIEITYLRGFRTSDPLTGEPGAIRKGFEWVEPEVVFTTNAVNPDYWLIRDWLDFFVPFDRTNKKTIAHMKKYGFMAYYNKDYQEGDGLLVIRNNVMLNPGRDVKAINQMEKENISMWLDTFMGATVQIGGLAYGDAIQFLNPDEILERKSIWPISCGVDHASAPEGDWFVAEFSGTSIDTQINGMAGYPSFKKLIYFQEYAWHNKLLGKGFKTDINYARDLLNTLKDMVDTNMWQGRIMQNGFFFNVDNANSSFIQTFRMELRVFMDENPQDGWLSRVRVVPVEGKNSKMKIDSDKKIDARQGRIQKNKTFLENKILYIDQFNCPMLFKFFKQTSLDKNGKAIDKNRDPIDAMDYAWMLEGIVRNIELQIYYKKMRN